MVATHFIEHPVKVDVVFPVLADVQRARFQLQVDVLNLLLQLINLAGGKTTDHDVQIV